MPYLEQASRALLSAGRPQSLPRQIQIQRNPSSIWASAEGCMPPAARCLEVSRRDILALLLIYLDLSVSGMGVFEAPSFSSTSPMSTCIIAMSQTCGNICAIAAFMGGRQSNHMNPIAHKILTTSSLKLNDGANPSKCPHADQNYLQ